MAVQGLEKLNRQLRRLPTAQVEAARSALQQGAEELEGKIKAAAPNAPIADNVGVEQGAGSDAVGREKIEGAADFRGDEGLAWRVYVKTSAGKNGEVYNPIWAEYGTKPHVITPKSGGYLKIGGGFAAGPVQHPGARAQPFFWPTVRAWKVRMKSRVVREANKAVRAAVNA